jgi:hypothetical protein
MRANISVHTRADTGYGRMGLEIRKALKSLGVVDYGATGTGSTEGAAVGFADPAQDDTPLAPVSFIASTPPHIKGRYKGQMTALLTMWESTAIPAGFRETLPVVDRLFVPSRHNVDLFSNFHPDVRYVPLGVGPEWIYKPRETLRERFNVLTGGAGPRKGIVDAQRAFRAAYEGWEGTKGGPAPHLTQMARDGVPGPSSSVIATKMSAADEVALYSQQHVFLSMTKGEGWGMMPLQAICQGLPTILPNAHGHEAFAHYGIATDVQMEACGNSTFWGDGGEWWVPDFDQTVEALRTAYAQYEDAVAYAYTASSMARSQFTWDHTAEELVFNLPELWNDDVADRVFIPAPQRLYPVKVIERKEFVINGVRHAFIPGIEDQVPWDIKMTLAMYGILDEAYIDPLEMGEEVAKAAKQKSADHRCPHCSQRYGSDRSLDLDALAAAGATENVRL